MVSAGRSRFGASLRSRLRLAWRPERPAVAGLAGAALVALVLLVLRWSGALQPLELAGYDRFVALRGAGPGTQARVVQVVVGEADIERFGWPLPDGVLAAAIARLHAAAPRAIGIDIFRPTPIPPGSAELAAAIAAAPELIWADRFGEETWAGIPPPEAAAARSGFADVLPDPGEIVRRGLLYLDDGRHVAVALPLRLALLYLRHEGIGALADSQSNLRLGHVSLPPLDTALGGYRGIDTRGYQILREFPAPQALRSIRFGALLDGTVPPADLAGRIVMVGVIADSVKDYAAAPIAVTGPATIGGVTLHGLFAAQLLAHALDGLPATRPLGRETEFALLLATIIGGGLAGTFASRLGWFGLAVFGGAAAWLAISYLAFLHGVWLPIVLLPLGWVIAALVAKTAAAQAEYAERVFLMRLFSTHISAPIAQEMWRRRRDFVELGRPKPVRLTATVLFSDINDFTTATEDMDPEAIVRWLEPYMQAMTQLIDDHGGVVERFSGDGVLAMFGVPLPRTETEEIAADAVSAVQCALRMGVVLERLNAAYREAGLPEIRVGIGIQSGDLVGCSLGSLERQQYTTMGDTTNTAARLVNVAKDVMKAQAASGQGAGKGEDRGVCVVIGRATRGLVAEQFALHPLGAVELKGKHRRTECFAVETAPVAGFAPASGFATGAKYG